MSSSQEHSPEPADTPEAAQQAPTPPDNTSDAERPNGTRLSRRGMIALFGAGIAGAAVGAAGTAAIGTLAGSAAQAAHGPNYDFYGETQAGIITPVQDRMHFAAFDLVEGLSRDELIELLSDWTYAASRLTQGLDVSASGAFGGGPYMPPDDTGEATGIAPAGLTITFGFGRTMFETADGQDRFGIASQLPADFAELPKMTNDFMVPARSGGDLCVQACSNDPQVAVHAIRNLTRIAVGRAVLHWSQLGFGRSSSTTRAQETPRNLFGQKDGTENILADQTEQLSEHVWIGPDSPQSWAVGGTYLVARRINMTIEVWDSQQLQEQERVTGRDKREGAPLSGGTEFTAPDFRKRGPDGELLIDERSHVSRVHPDHNDGIRILRRGFNFVDGNDAQGRLDAGLFFIAFVNSPAKFAQLHRSMSRDDLFVEYLKTTGSALFIVPPGITDGQYIGHQLFEAAAA